VAATRREDSVLEGIPGAAVRVGVRAWTPAAALKRTARQRGERGWFILGASPEIEFRAIAAHGPFQAMRSMSR
jgi:hypothetical protein